MSTHYRPILLTRQGERQALQDLTATEHDALTPIFVIPPIPWDFDNEAPSKTLEQYLAKLPEELAKARKSCTSYIDLGSLSESEIEQVNGKHALIWLHEMAALEGMTLIPVLSLNSGGELFKAARQIVETEKTGIALRLTVGEWPSTTDPKTFDSFLQDLGLSRDEIDLVLDLGAEVTSSSRPLAEQALKTEIQWVRNNPGWRSVTVAGAGMPDVQGKGVQEIERTDWAIFQAVRDTELDFGDYGIGNTNFVTDIDPRFMNISAQFRYTAISSWLVSRGGPYKANGGKSLGGAAVAPMLDALVKHGSYDDSAQDLAHRWISGVLNGASGGTPTVWRRWGTYHHLKMVLTQLAT